MIRFCNSLQVALSTVGILQTMLNEDKNYDAYIECFNNCREQGLIVRAGGYDGNFVIVSENRNSDDIVVYYGKTKKDIQDNMPTKEAWNNRKYFGYNEHYKAAEFMHEILFEDACS